MEKRINGETACIHACAPAWRVTFPAARRVALAREYLKLQPFTLISRDETPRGFA